MGSAEDAQWFIDNSCKELIESAPTIFPKNKDVKAYNMEALNNLENGHEIIEIEPTFSFEQGWEKFETQENINRLKEDETLYIKEGAKVMFTCNAYCSAPWLKNSNIPGAVRADFTYDWTKIHKNGTTGTVRGIRLNDDGMDYEILIEMDDPNCECEYLSISRSQQEVYAYDIDKETNTIKKVLLYRIRSFPIRLAYAVSIHKSQGQSFDKCNISVDGSFAHGMAYVALSRCKSIENCHIIGNIKSRDIIADSAVVDFYNEIRSSRDS